MTAPSRSAFSRMLCIRLIRISFDSERASGRNVRDAAENRQLERLANVALVVDRLIEILASERQEYAEAQAGQHRAEHDAQRNGLDRIGRVRGRLEHREPLAAPIALNARRDGRGALLRREIGVVLPLERDVSLDARQL